MFKGKNETSKIAVLATFKSQGGCTNWKGWQEGLNFHYAHWKAWDMINDNPDTIQSELISYSPSHIFVLLPDGYRLLNLAQIKEITGCKIAFFYQDYNCDIKHLPIAGKPMDYMFLSNTDQIAEYEEWLGIKVHYMPLACYEYGVKLPYNDKWAGKIVFVGNVQSFDEGSVHYKRSLFYRDLANHFQGRIVNVNVINYPERNLIYDLMPEIYNSAEYCLCMDGNKLPKDNHESGIRGYTSNRIWAVMNFGGLPVVQKFKEMEKIGLIDEENCLTFDPWDVAQFIKIIDKCDKDPLYRKTIKDNALASGVCRHTYKSRLAEYVRSVIE